VLLSAVHLHTMVMAQPTASKIMILLLTLQSFSTAQGGRKTRADAEYHPGHPPTYVTRLHRYEHAGVESMLEEEAKWEQEVKDMQTSSQSDRSLEGGSLLEQSDAPVPVSNDGFVKLGHKQVQQLVEHHKSLGYGQGLKEHPFDAPHGNTTPCLTPDSTTPGKTAVHRQQLYGTPLKPLGSQYVGPIGIGSVVSPLGCTMPAHGQFTNSSMPTRTDGFLSKKVVICIVTDQVQMLMVFDTGSTNIWVADVDCKTGPCNNPTLHKFNHSASATFHEPATSTELTVKFGTGKVSGHMAQDDIHIGPFSVYGQTFAMMKNADGIPPDIEGILGLAFPKMSANNVKPFFSTMIDQKALPHNEFAFYFSPDKRAGNALLWGGVDKAFYQGELQYFPVVEPYYWAVKLLHMKIGDEDMILKTDKNEGELTPPREYRGSVAILDTGTTFITADKDHFPAVMAKLPVTECSAVTKESHPDITITLENTKGKAHDFVLTNKQYMTKSNKEKQMCSPAFMQINIPEEHGPGWVLGDIFLRYYFAVFDRGDGDVANAKVALAPSRNDPETFKRLAELTVGQSFGKQEPKEHAKPAEHAEHEEHAKRAERAERAEAAEREERAKRAERAERAEGAERQERAQRAERAERAEAAERASRAATAGSLVDNQTDQPVEVPIARHIATR